MGGRARLALLGLFLTGCQAGVLTDGLSPTAKGALAVSVSGLPAGASFVVTVTGPAGFAASLVAGQTLSALMPGTYTVVAAEVTFEGNHWVASPGTQFITVVAKQTAAGTVAYAATTGSLQVSRSGLPAGALPAVVVSGPSNFLAMVVDNQPLTGLVPGSYEVAGTDLNEVGGEEYTPVTPVQQVTVVAGQLATADVAYHLATGRLMIAFTGVPSGGTPMVTVSGPAGYAKVVTASATLTGLAPGSYAVTAQPIDVGPDTWVPNPPTQVVAVVADPTPASVGIAWTQATAALAIVTAGLPDGVPAAIQVTGPNGYSHVVTGPETLTGLDPGSYAIVAVTVSAGDLVWHPVPASQTVQVTAGAVSSAGVAWSLQQGALQVTLSGVPAGATPAVTVAGPAGYSTVVGASTLLSALVPGTYTVTAPPVSVGGNQWAVSPASQVVTVGSLTAAASVGYLPVTGTLRVLVSGLPTAAAQVTVTGPGGFSAGLSASDTLPGLQPGAYQVAATSVTIVGITFAPTPASQSVTIAAGDTAGAVISHAAVTGRLVLTVTGLPSPSAQVTINGPGGFFAAASDSQTLDDLAPGAYQVAAVAVTIGGTVYQAAPLTQSVTVTAGNTVWATIGYTPGPAPTLNLQIAGAYLTQAVQRLDQGVQLVAGRDAYLRVFALANEANSATPRVLVRVFHGAVEVQNWLVSPGSPSVPLVVDEGQLATSWNLTVPGALVVPGMGITAEVDPGGLVSESDEGDNRFPATGVPMPVTVRTLLPFQVRLVPVLQSVNGLQGDATAANAPSYLTTLLKLLPIGDYDADVRAVYTTNAPVLQSGNGNGAWGTILNEVLALRNATDMSSRYYYGVVETNYSSGIAGLGYVPSSPSSTAKAAIGWDFPGSRARVMAHELGHNFGRQHAPCGGVAGPDPSYPYPGGQIGVWGLDPATLAVKPPTTFFDLMGYCPPNEWVSDYTWNAIVNFRSGSPTGAPPAAAQAAGADDGVLIWGRMTTSGLIVEPVFRVAPTVQGMPTRGAWRAEGRDAAGVLLFSQPFTPETVADLPGGPEQHFAMVLPVGASVADRIASVRVVGPGGTATRGPAPGAATVPLPVARRSAPGRQAVAWDATRVPMALIRDAATGEILSFARGGAIELWSNATALDLELSDGVQVVRRRVVVR